MAKLTMAWQWPFLLTVVVVSGNPGLHFFATLGQKSGPVLGPDSGPKMGTAIHHSILITIGGRKTAPFLGRNLAPEPGPFFPTFFAKK